MTQLIKLIGELVVPVSRPDFDRFTPEEFRGKDVHARAALVIAKGFQAGTEKVLRSHPELEHDKAQASEK